MSAAFQNISASLLDGDCPNDCDISVCSDDEHAREVAPELAEKTPGNRAINGGKLGPIVEQLTALLITLNTKYRVHGAGLRITGLPKGQDSEREKMPPLNVTETVRG